MLLSLTYCLAACQDRCARHARQDGFHACHLIPFPGDGSKIREAGAIVGSRDGNGTTELVQAIRTGNQDLALYVMQQSRLYGKTVLSKRLRPVRRAVVWPLLSLANSTCGERRLWRDCFALCGTIRAENPLTHFHSELQVLVLRPRSRFFANSQA